MRAATAPSPDVAKPDALAPMTGSMLVNTVSIPHNAANGMPSSQNMPPHSAPWMTAMTRTPYTLP